MWVLLLITMNCCFSSKILYIIPNTSASLSRDEENFRAFYKDGQLFSRDRAIDVKSGVYNVLLEDTIGQYFDNELSYHVKEAWVRPVPSIPLQTSYKLSVLRCDIVDAEAIYWQKKKRNGAWTNLKDEGDRMYVTRLNTLVLQGTVEGDLGRYRCVVLDKELKVTLVGPDLLLEEVAGHSQELEVISNNSLIVDHRGVYIIAASIHRDELLGYLPIEFFTRHTCYYTATDGTTLNILRSGPYCQALTSSSLATYLHGSYVTHDVISSSYVTSSHTTAILPTAAYSCPIISLKLDIIEPPVIDVRIMPRVNTVTFAFGYSDTQRHAHFYCFLNARPLPSSENVVVRAIGSEIKVEFLCPADIYYGYLQCAIQTLHNKLWYYSRPVRIEFATNSSCSRSTLVNITSRSAVVSWPCIVNITRYVVSVKLKEDSLLGGGGSLLYKSSKCNLEVTNLKPGTTYRYYVTSDTRELIVAAVTSYFTTLSSLPSVSNISMNCKDEVCVVRWSSPHPDTSYIVTMKTTEDIHSKVLMKRVTRVEKVKFRLQRQYIEEPCKTIISIVLCYKDRCQLKGTHFTPSPIDINVKAYHNHIDIHFRSGPCLYLLVKFNDRIIKFTESPGVIGHLKGLSKHILWYQYVTYGNNSESYVTLNPWGNGLMVTLPLNLWLVGVIVGLSVVVVVILVIVWVKCKRTRARKELIRQQPWDDGEGSDPLNITIRHD